MSSLQLRQSVFGIVAIALMIVGFPAHATDPGRWNVQLYGGWYAAGDLESLDDVQGGLDDTLEELGVEPGDDVTFGVRFGRRETHTWGWEFSLGFFDVDEAAERLEDRAKVDIGLGLLDLSFMYYPGGGDFFLYGGPGAANVDIKIENNGVEAVDDNSTEFSVNAGLGYLFSLSPSYFIRLDGKARYYDSDNYEGPDGEFTAAIGWNY